eukprot:8448405-Alexandrium_andersonii.AAC.1
MAGTTFTPPTLEALQLCGHEMWPHGIPDVKSEPAIAWNMCAGQSLKQKQAPSPSQYLSGRSGQKDWSKRSMQQLRGSKTGGICAHSDALHCD